MQLNRNKRKGDKSKADHRILGHATQKNTEASRPPHVTLLRLSPRSSDQRLDHARPRPRSGDKEALASLRLVVLTKPFLSHVKLPPQPTHKAVHLRPGHQAHAAATPSGPRQAHPERTGRAADCHEGIELRMAALVQQAARLVGRVHQRAQPREDTGAPPARPWPLLLAYLSEALHPARILQDMERPVPQLELGIVGQDQAGGLAVVDQQRFDDVGRVQCFLQLCDGVRAGVQEAADEIRRERACVCSKL